MSNIPQSKKRFEEILKEKIRKDLKKLIKSDYLLGKRGKDKVVIPINYIDIPKFRHGKREEDQIGQGEGEEGQPIRKHPGEKSGQAGDEPGEHETEYAIPLKELMDIFQEELELPNIQPKGKKRIYKEFLKFHGLRRKGPDGLMRFKKSYLEALQREVASGTYNVDDPVIIITPDDKRYRSWKEQLIPESDAVVIYMMDVSGSMGDKQKNMARKISFWTDAFLRKQYKGLESVYITHDAQAREVDEHTFYHTRESGGTKISSAYDLGSKIMEARYPSDEWNIYCYHFSDGDNWGGGDNELSCKILRDSILPHCNMFWYAQLPSDYGSGKFIRELDRFKKETKLDNILTYKLKSDDDILEAIKLFLGKGK